MFMPFYHRSIYGIKEIITVPCSWFYDFVFSWVYLLTTPIDFDEFRFSMFQDARQRPDAKTLLSHPWIQNSRRALQSSLRHSGTIR